MAAGRSGLDLKLVEAARRCDVRTLENLVKEGKANLNAKDKAGCTAVHLCCKAADLASLALLLAHGARTDSFDNSGMAPIHHAAMKDYIETMAVLMSYGANVNIHNVKTKQTPLHVAAASRNSRSIKFLLFCGADTQRGDKSGNVADLGLSKEQLQKHGNVRTGFRDGHIQVFGKMINRMERYKFQSVGMAIANTSTKSRQFSFFCRKISVDHVSLDLTEHQGIKSHLKDDCKELISDIYEYLVNQVVEDVRVSVPVATKATYFDTVYILDNTGNMYRCTEMKEIDQIIYYTACMALRAYEDTVYSFAVVMKTKSDLYILDGTAQTLTSSVETGFMIQLPENCLPKNTEVAMKVIPTREYQKTLNTDLVKSTSHFCEIRINQKNRKAPSITLPMPIGDTEHQGGEHVGHTEHEDGENDTRIAVFHSNEAGETQPDWKEIDCMRKPGTDNVIVTDKTINKGTCIVAEIPKKKGNDIFGKIKQFIAWLYDTAFRRKAHVCFFALTKHCSRDNFRILVGICDTGTINENVKKWEREQYIRDFSQQTPSYLVSAGTRFFAQLNLTGENIKGSDKIFLIYHRQRLSHQDFVVTGKEHDFLQVEIYKVQTQSNEGETARCLNSFLTQINVELLIKQHENVDNASSLQFKEYPDNRFLSWLAQEIGHEWMLIGICLGFNTSFLERIEKDNTPTRANLTMLYAWRNEQETKEDLGLKVLLQSLASAQRKDLVTKINKEVQALLATKPNERVCRWVKKLSGENDMVTEEVGGLDDIDGPLPQQLTKCSDTHSEKLCISCLVEPEQAVSPLSEKFLVHLATMMGSNIQLILQLGLSRPDIDETRHNIRDPTAAMFKSSDQKYRNLIQQLHLKPELKTRKCLLLAKRRYKEQVEFFTDIMDGLKIQRNLQTIWYIRDLCRDWFRKNRSAMDSQMRKLEQLMDKY